METYEQVKEKWMEVKAQYSELIQKRIDLLDAGDFETLTAQNGDSKRGYFPEEKALFKQSEELRNQLRSMNPAEFAFGKKNKSDSSLYFHGVEFSKYGDNGYFICEECKALFECPPYHKGKDMGVDCRAMDSFKNCSEHEHLTKSATMYANQGAIEWL
jgi:hypothetical protein